ncbi:hypothetical protein OA40_12085 [Morganella morganii]|nr:hypothetical protein OA40_12085 [Morganella morganii]
MSLSYSNALVVAGNKKRPPKRPVIKLNVINAFPRYGYRFSPVKPTEDMADSPQNRSPYAIFTQKDALKCW